MRKLPANRENDVHDLLSKPNIQLLMQKFDCQIKDIKHQGESLPFEQVYKFRQQAQNNNLLKSKIHFSFFKGGIVQTTPYKNISIAQIHQLIIGDYLQQSTQKVKELYRKSLETGNKKAFDLQKRKLHYVTFSGIFSQRKDNCLIRHSNLYCLDCDKITNPELLKQQILKIRDDYFETVLLFTSPSGYGVKWVIYMPPNNHKHKVNFMGIQNFILQRYGIPSDDTPDVSRACFVCHDPKCFVNPKFLQP